MKMQIRHRHTGQVIFEARARSLKDAVEAAVKKGVDLTFANLRGADLSRANLRGARLGNADLENARLDGADTTGATLPSRPSLLGTAKPPGLYSGGMVMGGAF